MNTISPIGKDTTLSIESDPNRENAQTVKDFFVAMRLQLMAIRGIASLQESSRSFLNDTHCTNNACNFAGSSGFLNTR
ncbi:Uncharacterised protein [Serratia plymuthica]|nr:Uncharacterised protein [Serratia plymuthica]VEI20710.1 Uncharacterised protein [Serratia plymuthica]